VVQITPAPQTPYEGATPPQPPFFLPPSLTKVAEPPPPPNKIPGYATVQYMSIWYLFTCFVMEMLLLRVENTVTVALTAEYQI